MEEESLIRIAHLRNILAWSIFKILVSLLEKNFLFYIGV